MGRRRATVNRRHAMHRRPQGKGECHRGVGLVENMPEAMPTRPATLCIHVRGKRLKSINTDAEGGSFWRTPK